MNKALRFYLGLGICLLVTTYIVAISLWVKATQDGLATGTYFVSIYTNLLGENYFELGILLAFIPAVLYLVVKVIFRLVRSDF